MGSPGHSHRWLHHADTEATEALWRDDLSLQVEMVAGRATAGNSDCGAQLDSLYRFNAIMPFSTTVIVVAATSLLRRCIRKRLPSRLGT